MGVLHTILTIVQVILAVGLVVIVTLQSGKSAGLSSAIGGGSGGVITWACAGLGASLLQTLQESGIERIVVVDDGSGNEYRNLFEQAKQHGAIV